MFRNCSEHFCYYVFISQISLNPFLRGDDKTLRRVVGLLVLLAGIALVFYPQIEKMFYDHEQQALIDSFEQLGDTELLQHLSTDAEGVIQTDDVLNVEKSIASDDGKKDKQMLEGAQAILRIDSIDLEMIVFNGATANNLSKGAGIVEPKKKFGVNNVGLAGHRALVKGKQFNRLDELEPNDIIEVTTQDGVLKYEVTRNFVVPKTQVSVLNDTGTPLITLITCTPVGKSNPPDRLIVQAQLK